MISCKRRKAETCENGAERRGRVYDCRDRGRRAVRRSIADDGDGGGGGGVAEKSRL